MEKVKMVIFVPESAADVVREAIAKAGAGRIGNYTSCSFSLKGVGRFKPEVGASPAIGEIGRPEEVAEERIEFLCPKNLVKKTIREVKKVHPYEEVIIDIYPLLDLD